MAEHEERRRKHRLRPRDLGPGYQLERRSDRHRDCTNNTYEDRECDWNANATTIVFHSNQAGNDDIFTMTASGASRTQLTNYSTSEANPSWTPDGRIMFNTTRNYNNQNPEGNIELWIMNANGTGQTQITFTGTGVDNLFPDVRDRYTPYDWVG